MSLLPAFPGLEQLSEVGDRMVASAMRLVHGDQLYPEGDIEVKGDLSLVLPTDKRVERQLRAWAAQIGLPFYGEEFGAVAGVKHRFLLVADPVDGSRPLANRHSGGSTIILYLYDTEEGRIVATIIACPGTGEVWVAVDGETHLYQYSYESGKFTKLRRCRVWEFDSRVSRPTVYVDNPNPFTRRGVDMLRADGLDHMDSELRRLSLTKFAVGSNGLHHCLVASGGPVVGSITTSIGGVQDLGGIKVVEDAGGCVAAFSLTHDRKLLEADPHADMFMAGGTGYDFLVTAIDRSWLGTLIAVLNRGL